MEFRIHHIAISVKHLQETLDFYKDIFGFSEYCKSQDNNMEIWLLELQDIKLEIFYFKDFQKLPDYRKNNSTDLPTLGVKHFALEVRNIEKTLLYLQEKGVEIITEIKTGRNPVKYFFFKDPNGILVEIIQDI